MVSFSLPFIDIAYAVFLLVPGFITYQIARLVGKVTVEIDRFDKTAYMLLASGISISLVLIGYSLLTANSVTAVVNADYSLAELGAGYIVILGFASGIGYGAG